MPPEAPEQEAKPPSFSRRAVKSSSTGADSSIVPIRRKTDVAAKIVSINRGFYKFPTGPVSRQFRKRHFPEVTPEVWNDWRWQLQNRIRCLADLERFFDLSTRERAVLECRSTILPVAITPYYASLMAAADPADPLRRTHIPTDDEFVLSLGEADDPLGEGHDEVVPGLVHRYPDRVLFMTTPVCSTYCRYCTRSRLVGNTDGWRLGGARWEQALSYIESHPEIRDVLLSGGDPLTLDTNRLDWLLGRLRSIKHVEIIRIGTKVPVVLPMRITSELTRMLRRHHPLWMSIHFTHPQELTREVTEACARLAGAGIPLGSQTVLLKGINDDVETMKNLMHGLMMRRVKPYYLYQCDPISGSIHFRTPLETGLDIIRGLRGHTSGYAVPTYVIDAPGGGGKIPLLPNSIIERDGDDILLVNYAGTTHRYPDPATTSQIPTTETSPCALV
ncbi:MAG: KamA family radical SAM protein [Rhodospirillales bacterium]|nr:KamA family radical SAM protein [Rhodospirillales bacterium]